MGKSMELCLRSDLKHANSRIAALEAELAEARKDRKALYDAMREVCRIAGGQTADGVSVDFLLHVPAEVEAKLAEARCDGERLLKLGGMLAYRPHLSIWIDENGNVRIADQDTDGETISGTGKHIGLAIDDAARGGAK